ncbi:hypothetical protein CRENBAI_003825 [Crenichthys baileyi]|uniref:Uncharacterized protein n=1 Tax=Crenichthys baileyi TaxID=28760 RepID=A0AAV9S2F3_9TELE
MDLFMFPSREAEKTLRRSAGLSVLQSAYDGSRLAIPCPGTGSLSRRSSTPLLHSAAKLNMRAAASNPASSSATALSPRQLLGSSAHAIFTCSSPVFFGNTRRAGGELREKIRQMEEDYETAVRQFYCRPPPSSSGLQSGAAAQSKPGLQSTAAEQFTPRHGPRVPLQLSRRQGSRAPLQLNRRHVSRTKQQCLQSATIVQSKSASTSSTCCRGHRKRDASAQVFWGPGNASAPAQATEGAGDAPAPAQATEGPSDASAPAQGTEGPGETSAPAHATSRPSSSWFLNPVMKGLRTNRRQILDKGFEEEAPPDPVSEGFERQLTLVLASEGPPDSASASKGPPDSASASECPVGSVPDSKPESKPDFKPPEFHRVPGGSSMLQGRPPDLLSRGSSTLLTRPPDRGSSTLLGRPPDRGSSTLLGRPPDRGSSTLLGRPPDRQFLRRRPPTLLFSHSRFPY